MSTTNPLAWIRNLSEVGTLTRHADRIDEQDAMIARLESELRAAKRERARLVRVGEHAVREHYSDSEIAESMRSAS